MPRPLELIHARFASIANHAASMKEPPDHEAHPMLEDLRRQHIHQKKGHRQTKPENHQKADVAREYEGTHPDDDGKNSQSYTALPLLVQEYEN